MIPSEPYLDLVLTELNQTGLPISSDELDLALSGKLDGKILWQLLAKLERDVYVIRSDKYLIITEDGKIFNNDGGYTKKKQIEIELYMNSNESLKNSKKSICWAKWNTVFVILGVILMIITVYLMINPKSNT